jgi:aspartate kinase
MNIIVQKFGGTSVSTEEGRQHCLKHIRRELDNGNKLVVVVSAMGRKGEPYATDTLLSLIEPSAFSNKRDLDLLLSTGELISASVFSSMLSKDVIPNTVLTGGQAGIITNEAFNEAKIISLQPNKIIEELNKNNVVVVAGFQGSTTNGEITTLGRGGSDTSATALGAALNASRVDVFTDVDGIFTADPRIVEKARSLSTITYAEICNLAHLGAKVIHPRAVEIAMQKNIPVRVRSTFSDNEGTLITNSTDLEKNEEKVKDDLISGITQTSDLVQIIVKKNTTNNDFPLDIFDRMRLNEISVDFINLTPNTATYTVSEKDKIKTLEVLEELNYHPNFESDFAKVSVVGANMSGVPGVMSQVISALHKRSIKIYQSADSHTTIWVLVKSRDTKNAVCSLHDQFSLETPFQHRPIIEELSFKLTHSLKG